MSSVLNIDPSCDLRTEVGADHDSSCAKDQCLHCISKFLLCPFSKDIHACYANIYTDTLSIKPTIILTEKKYHSDAVCGTC